jgi:hypothetical protein
VILGGNASTLPSKYFSAIARAAALVVFVPE